jgi:hypothetical protein
MQFPVHVYKSPGNYELRGKSYKVASVADQDALQAHVDAGWSLTLTDAFQAAGEAAVIKRKVADWRTVKARQKQKRKDFLAARAKAREPKEPVPVVQAAEPDDNAPPTRQELEHQATLLGIKFDGRTTDKRLLDRISEAMKES